MADSMRARLEQEEDARLAPWALRSAGAERRHPVQDEGRAFAYRTEFQRDRDRIVYSRAFRRLRQKAQAGILPAYEDHRRNRLTHTLEVAQLSRTVARALRLNEDLAEAVALGHDLGQPPFGPAGERALDDLLSGRLEGQEQGAPGDLGGFRRTWQGLRVIDLLEKRYEHPGLNLTDPVREGILKSSGDLAVLSGPIDGLRPGAAPALEAQVVALADRMASALHDLDDALQSGAVDLAQVERLAAVQALRKKLGARYRAKASRFMKANAIHRGLTHLLVTGAILASEAAVGRWASRLRVNDRRRFLAVRDADLPPGLVQLPPAARRLLQDLEDFLGARVHRGYEADQVDGRGRRVLLGLFSAYRSDPTLLPDHALLRFKEIAGVRYLRDVPRGAVPGEIARQYRGDSRFARLLADHLAGMTDAYAVAEHARLREMAAVQAVDGAVAGTEGSS